MKENIISGGLFEEGGPVCLVEGPVSKRTEEIPLSEYERFLRATGLKPGPILTLWPEGMWTYLGNEGAAPKSFVDRILELAKLACDTPMRKEDPRTKAQVEDWGAKAKLFRAGCLRAKTNTSGKPWA